MTNHARALTARSTVVYYSQIKGNNSDDQDTQTDIVDLLCDLMHYATEGHIDFMDCLATAEMHFIAKTI